MKTTAPLADLPQPVALCLTEVVELSARALGNDLKSLVLYGSGAEGRMRATSDVNLLFVLSVFNREKIDGIREQLRLAQSSMRLSAMFLLETEIGLAAESFAVKFGDIMRRRRVLYGADYFADIVISRESRIYRLRQVLTNLALRLRERYVMRGLREEQLASVIADAAPPLRSSAATILELEGGSAPSSKEALESLCKTLGDRNWSAVLQNLSKAREGEVLPPGIAADTLFRLIELCGLMRERVERLA